jgi:hypothetical protein
MRNCQRPVRPSSDCERLGGDCHAGQCSHPGQRARVHLDKSIEATRRACPPRRSQAAVLCQVTRLVFREPPPRRPTAGSIAACSATNVPQPGRPPPRRPTAGSIAARVASSRSRRKQRHPADQRRAPLRHVTSSRSEDCPDATPPTNGGLHCGTKTAGASESEYTATPPTNGGLHCGLRPRTLTRSSAARHPADQRRAPLRPDQVNSALPRFPAPPRRPTAGSIAESTAGESRERSDGHPRIAGGLHCRRSCAAVRLPVRSAIPLMTANISDVTTTSTLTSKEVR